MPQAVAGPEIERLIQLLARMPGLGPRSARRAALQLIKKRETLLAPLADAMRVAADRIVTCQECGNVDTQDPCTICRDHSRDPSILVVVEDGQTTAHYVTELMAHLPIKVTRLAHGVPVGGELDYLDEGTLSAAIRQRTAF
jgi:recombinational DNA repair protein RecR